MTTKDTADLFGTMIRVENKDIFIDLRRNRSGVYLKLAERNGKSRSTILMPASGVSKLRKVLEEVEEVLQSTSNHTSRSESSASIRTNKLFVSNLAWSTTSLALKNHFAQVGGVVNAEVAMKSREGEMISRGFGIVEFETSELVTKAIESMKGSVLEGREIRCREDRKDSQLSDSSQDQDKQLVPTKVFVTSLPWSVTNDELRGLFSSCGIVTKAEVAITNRGRSLGRGVVEFEDAASASAAIATLNGTDAGGRIMTVREFYA